jgi:EmrB/QacA subfamily drug resistance transporter
MDHHLREEEKKDYHDTMHAQHDEGSIPLTPDHPANSPGPLKPPQCHAADDETAMPEAVSLPPMRVRWRTPIVMTLVCAGGLVTALDAVIVGTALPSIASDLSATTTELAWVGASYLVGAAVLQPVWPTLSDLTGRKLAFAFGFVLFAAGSLIAALAHHAAVLIAGRTVQGLGAGNIILLCNVIISDLFPLRERGLYIGIYAATSCLGAALGPVVGGLLTSYTGWRWIFFMNLPFAGVALAVIAIFLDLPRISHNTTLASLGEIDWPGSALIVTATTLFLVGLQLGGVALPWDSATVIGLIVAGCTTAAIFVVQQRFHQQPLIPPRIFATRSSAACLAVGFLHGFTYIACLYYLPLYFQLVLGASPVKSGLWLLITAVPMSFITVAAALVIVKTGWYRQIIWISASCLTLGLGLAIAFPSRRSWPLIVFVLLLIAAGIGPLFQAPLLALQAQILAEDTSRANGAFAFTRTMSSAIGLVIGQVVLQNELRNRLKGPDTAGIPQDLLDRVAKQVTALADLKGLPLEMQDVLRKILTDSLSRVWIVFTATAGMCLLVGFLIGHKKLSAT